MKTYGDLSQLVISNVRGAQLIFVNKNDCYIWGDKAVYLSDEYPQHVSLWRNKKIVLLCGWKTKKHTHKENHLICSYVHVYVE